MIALLGLLIIVGLTIAAATLPAVWEAVLGEQAERRAQDYDNHGGEYLADK